MSVNKPPSSLKHGTGFYVRHQDGKGIGTKTNISNFGKKISHVSTPHLTCNASTNANACLRCQKMHGPKPSTLSNVKKEKQNDLPADVGSGISRSMKAITNHEYKPLLKHNIVSQVMTQ
jgi:hypothetical protein